MKPAPRPPPTALFTVRFWQERVDATQSEWRGEVKRLANGETYYFRDWQTLAQHIAHMLEDSAPIHSNRSEEEDP